MSQENPTVADQYDVGDATHQEVDDPIHAAPNEGAGSPHGGTVPPTAAATPRGPDGRFTAGQSPKHSPRSLRMAVELGMSQEEIDSTAPDALDDLVYHLTRQAMRLSREHSRQEVLQSPPKTAKEANPTPSPVDLGLKDESIYDDDLLGVLKRQQEQIRQQQEQIGQLLGHHQKQREQTITQRADQWFAKNEARYGKGTRRDLADDSADLVRRRLILEQASKMGANEDNFEQVLAKADAMIYGTAEAPRGGTKSISMQEWEEAGLSRPTQRSGSPEPKGERKAMATAARILRDRDMLDKNGDTPADAFPE